MAGRCSPNSYNSQCKNRSGEHTVAIDLLSIYLILAEVSGFAPVLIILEPQTDLSNDLGGSIKTCMAGSRAFVRSKRV